MKSCPRCGRQNEDDVQFCGRCGLDFVEYAKHQTRSTTADDEFCYRHPKEQTNLKCGRCLRPICAKCAIMGSAGPRCPECAKQNIEFRPAAVVHSAKRTIFKVGKLGPFGIYFSILIIMMIFGLFRGCGTGNDDQYSRPVQIEQGENKSGN
jgi:hypothetical protein